MKKIILALAIFGSANAFAQNAATNNVATDAEKPLRLNFRGVPLDMVLNYMSEAAGFVINIAPGTEVKGRVDVWSNQPLNKEEAVQLLNTVLNQNNLASIRNGRTLTIVSRADAKTRDIPVRKGAKPEDIAKSDEMVTQIIPVQYANAAQLVQNLQPLLPEYAQNGLTANESGNALLLTATQTDVRRMTEIVEALDTSISSVSSIRVFALRYADAKELVTAVKELFTPPTTAGNNTDRRSQFVQQMFGGGGPGGGGGGPFGGGRGGGGNTGGGARGNTSQTASRVIAVADERSNALIVAAPDDSIPTIEKLVKEIDVPVEDITELRVFPLVNSDPNEISTILAELFPDETTSSTAQSRFGGGFGGFGGFGGGRGGQAGTAASSDRMKKKGRVISVADARTSSLIVSAASELMPQIEAMIKQLDSSRAKKQRVYVYNIENGDPQQIEEVVRSMFDRSNNSRNNLQNSALQNRSQQAAQNQGLQQQQGGFGGQGGGNNVGNTLR